VNKFAEGADEQPIEVHRNDPEVERRQVENLARVKRERDSGQVQRLLAELQEVVRDPGANAMPITIEAVKARASMGEIVSAVREVLGQYTERPVF
jgi:methylmalonyl-CoA mutase N-terminal domain/subunit